MRKLVWVALAALIVILFFLLTLPAESAGAQAAEQNKSGVSLGIYSSQLADSGNGTTAVMQAFMYGYDGGSLRAFCQPEMLQQNIIILSHAQAPGVGAELSEKLASALARCGFSSRVATADDALSSKNAAIIAPTGAVPSEFVGKEEELAKSNNRLIVLVLLSGRQIDANGRMSTLAESGFETVGLSPGEGEKAASDAAMLAMIPKNLQKSLVAFSEGNGTIAVAAGTNFTYCRLAYVSPLSCRHADSGLLAKPQGSLNGPDEVLAGKNAQFEFSLPDGSEIGRDLKFYAATYCGREGVSHKEIAGGKIAEGFASRFTLSFQQGGKCTVNIEDQFGRLHAAAYVRSLALEAKLVQQQGSRYEYRLLFGGEGASGPVEAWIDDGQKKEYSASNGTLIIWAAPSEGSHTMHFSYSGLSAQSDFYAQGGGLLETYLRLGVPAAIFLLAVFVLLRAGRKAKYMITFPEFAETPTEMLGADAAAIVRAYGQADRKRGGFCLPAYPEEIGKELLAMMGKKEGATLDPHSVLRALRELSQEGVFAEAEGAFVPAENMSGFSAQELCMLRLLHDCMLERGVPFRKGAVVEVKKGGIEFSLFRGRKSVLGKIGRNERVVLFESREALDEFERSLGAPDEENAMIKIAMGNGKVRFAAALRNEILGLLP
ncbi:Uncharacterised protein [uncultured archaeon]|nr:Uncharacterised protein [uncultured archaeon]